MPPLPKELLISDSIMSCHSSLDDYDKQGALLVNAAINIMTKNGMSKLMNLSPNDPAIYKSNALYDAIAQSSNELQLVFGIGHDESSTKSVQCGQYGSICRALAAVLLDASPPNRSDEFNGMLDVLASVDDIASDVERCMEAWQSNWSVSEHHTAFGMGPTWLETKYSKQHQGGGRFGNSGEPSLTKFIYTNAVFFVMDVNIQDWRTMLNISGNNITLFSSVFCFSYEIGYEWVEMLKEQLGQDYRDAISAAPI